ncbi:MAG: type II toxin-antitoxin system VapC family toxin [Bacteroidetes bacterium]|nr:type II toxin-antitoxin system VapC family toxin [Bacteroidota bacterium]MCL6102531.1 type II toxin-antitoxin system VapC family toxin [Bacteroidota bacterium]
MNIFFDTSSLFKLYHREEGTDALIELFNKVGIEILYLAEITRIEFSSVVWKKCRKNEIDEGQAQLLIQKFEKDSVKFTFVPEGISLRRTAQELIGTHWKIGLRTLDAIQLASALSVKNKINLFSTADKLLSHISEIEGLSTK